MLNAFWLPNIFLLPINNKEHHKHLPIHVFSIRLSTVLLLKTLSHQRPLPCQIHCSSPCSILTYSSTHDKLIASSFLKYFFPVDFGLTTLFWFFLLLWGHSFLVSFAGYSSPFWLFNLQCPRVPSLELVSSPSLHSLGGLIQTDRCVLMFSKFLCPAQTSSLNSRLIVHPMPIHLHLDI